MPGKVAPVQPRLRRRCAAAPVRSSPCSPCSALKKRLRVAARGSGPPYAEVEPSRSPAFPLLISNRADAEREHRHDTPLERHRRHGHRRTRRQHRPLRARRRIRSATSRPGTITTPPASSGTRPRSPKQTCPFDPPEDKGRPTRVGPIVMYAPNGPDLSSTPLDLGTHPVAKPGVAPVADPKRSAPAATRPRPDECLLARVPVSP